MQHFLGRSLFIFVGILIGFALVWIFNRLFKVKAELNLFNAVNGFLIAGLLANIYFGLFNQGDEFMKTLAPINIAVIIFILIRRYKKYQK